MSFVKYIDEENIEGKKVLLRVDFNVSLSLDHMTIADDARIRQALPTIQHLLKNNNRLIMISHLGRPKGRESKFSLKIVADYLHTLLPDYTVTLIDDFLNEDGREKIAKQHDKEIIMLENIRYYPQEKNNEDSFAKSLSSLADCYVNDAFGVSHRTDASLVGVPKYLPSFGGLLMKKEVEMISKALNHPRKPVVAIIGGAKISTKINLLGHLMEIADYLIIGGGLANTFFCAQGIDIGQSVCEYSEVENARKLLFLAAQKQTTVVLPSDVIESDSLDCIDAGKVQMMHEIKKSGYILDIGPQTEAQFASIIMKAKTIIWNGPIGYIENPTFRRGTDFIYYLIAENKEAVSIVGGGDTLAAISKKEYLNKITHVSTGGGAMLEFIEKGTLPGIEALKQ